MHTHSRLRRGFTLMEVMTAVVILTILGTLAVTFMVYGVGKARVNNAVFDVAALITTAQLRAVSSGTPHYVFFHQTPDKRLRIQTLERPDLPPLIPDWNVLDLSNGIEDALEFERALPPPGVGTELVPPPTRDQLTLGVGSGLDSGGLSFLDLDSTRIQRPLPAPYQAISLHSDASNGTPDIPTGDLIAGCNFCVDVG
ncbi:MAG: prepilin-type N-terminal cleavage/methylation domain-containing protein, partial [Myxococcaceae bacterium]|nr:prepilin-type N-terminal cleavage/methylation domain-containing protein [Myxococcaceae bacterium]